MRTQALQKHILDRPFPRRFGRQAVQFDGIRPSSSWKSELLSRWQVFGLVDIRNTHLGGRFLLAVASQLLRVSASESRRSFPLTAAGQSRIQTGFPLIVTTIARGQPATGGKISGHPQAVNHQKRFGKWQDACDRQCVSTYVSTLPNQLNIGRSSGYDPVFTEHLRQVGRATIIACVGKVFLSSRFWLTPATENLGARIGATQVSIHYGERKRLKATASGRTVYQSLFGYPAGSWFTIVCLHSSSQV